MHPKIRSPLVSWLLTVMTGGIYLFFWVWLVATELNNAEQKNVFPVKLWRNATVTLYILALVGFLLALNAVTSLLAVAAILGLVGLFLSVQVSIGNYIKCKDGELNTGKKYSNVLSVFLLFYFFTFLLFYFFTFLLFLVANTGVAYMQSGINRVIRYEQDRS